MKWSIGKRRKNIVDSSEVHRILNCWIFVFRISGPCEMSATGYLAEHKIFIQSFDVRYSRIYSPNTDFDIWPDIGYKNGRISSPYKVKKYLFFIIIVHCNLSNSRWPVVDHVLDEPEIISCIFTACQLLMQFILTVLVISRWYTKVYAYHMNLTLKKNT